MYFNIFTIGYQGVGVESFLDSMQNAGVKRVIDVRWNAVSRQRGFSRNALCEALGERGIYYTHMPELGVPPERRRNLRSAKSYSELFDFYLENLRANRQYTIGSLVSLVRSHPCALMCMEADPARCHRTPLAQYVASIAGMSVVEIGEIGSELPAEHDPDKLLDHILRERSARRGRSG
jgi:uncharacterized protein (DUF488 family)